LFGKYVHEDEDGDDRSTAADNAVRVLLSALRPCIAVQYEDVMSWVRALYNRRELVFSLVETVSSDNDDDLSAALINDDSAAPTAAAAAGSSSHKASRRRNASLKVQLVLFRLLTLYYLVAEWQCQKSICHALNCW